MPKLTFLPNGVTVEVAPGTTVFEAAREAGVVIPSQCGGMCACALCKVRVQDGSGALPPMRDNERAHLGNVFFITRERLSCQLAVHADLVVEIPEQREKVKKRYIPYSVIRRQQQQAAADAEPPSGRRGPRGVVQAEAEADARRDRSLPGAQARSARGSLAERFRLDADEPGLGGDRLMGSQASDEDYFRLFRGRDDDRPPGQERAPAPPVDGRWPGRSTDDESLPDERGRARGGRAGPRDGHGPPRPAPLDRRPEGRAERGRPEGARPHPHEATRPLPRAAPGAPHSRGERGGSPTEGRGARPDRRGPGPPHRPPAAADPRGERRPDDADRPWHQGDGPGHGAGFRDRRPERPDRRTPPSRRDGGETQPEVEGRPSVPGDAVAPAGSGADTAAVGTGPGRNGT